MSGVGYCIVWRKSGWSAERYWQIEECLGDVQKCFRGTEKGKEVALPWFQGNRSPLVHTR